MIRSLSVPRNLILVDGCGACLTGVSTWFLLAGDLLPTGIPSDHLRYLAIVAFCFALLDGFALFFKWKPSSFLRFIAVLNFGYCFCVLLSLCIFRGSVTNLGFAYLAIEIAIVLMLASWEWLVADSAS